MYYLVKLTELYTRTKKSYKEEHYDFEMPCGYCDEWNMYKKSEISIYGMVLCKKCGENLPACPACEFSTICDCENLDCEKFYNKTIEGCH